MGIENYLNGVTTKASIQDSRRSYARATTELLLTGATGPIHEVHISTGNYNRASYCRCAPIPSCAWTVYLYE
ncbi:MAG: hypothetical protein P4L56_20370 [Candidatus Sulfopaludibacter sp.]|nr:hypothetical protein [Candidatus Sulfopaludibacter sp.]